MGSVVDMHKPPAWVGTLGLSMYLVRAATEAQARENVLAEAHRRSRQPGLFSAAAEVRIRRATPNDLLLFAEVADVAIEQPELVT